MKNAARASKVADYVVSVSKLMSHTVAGTLAAIDTYYAVQDYKSAKEAGTLTFADRAKVVLCVRWEPCFPEVLRSEMPRSR